MECVTTVRYTIRFNGQLLDSFTPTRGIRQGDPLSPYLFLFVADGLSCLIRKEIENNSLREFHICRRAPGISHLLFADDSLLFFEASVNQASVIKSILNRYEKGTGQLVSLGKCSVLFGDQCILRLFCSSPHQKLRMICSKSSIRPIGNLKTPIAYVEIA